jgi:hypothetical protein
MKKNKRKVKINSYKSVVQSWNGYLAPKETHYMSHINNDTATSLVS